MWGMVLARSKVTAQGQVSVPAKVRERLGIQPGAALEWEAGADGTVIVRRAGRYSSLDIHRVLFPEGPPQRAATVKDMDEAITEHFRREHARGRY